MSQATAIVPTAHASRYLQQLCKHWANKFPVAFTPEHGQIDLGEDRLVILDADSEKLTVGVKTSAENLARLQEVVVNHIVRFAFREELVFNWEQA